MSRPSRSSLSRSRVLAVSFGAAWGGCTQHAPTATVPTDLRRVDLPAALATAERERSPGTTGPWLPTGSVTAARLDPRREAAVSLWARYVLALYHRSLPEAQELFADTITGLEGTNLPVARDTLMGVLDRAMQSLATGGKTFAEVFDRPSVDVRRMSDFGSDRPPPGSMEPDDLWVTGVMHMTSTASISSPVQGPPTVLLVRWIAGEPRIVAVSDGYLRVRR